jgi:hypothetical protein
MRARECSQLHLPASVSPMPVTAPLTKTTSMTDREGELLLLLLQLLEFETMSN